MLPIQTARPEHNAKLEKTAAVLTAVAHGMSAQVMDCLHGSGICEKFEVPDGAGRYLRDGLHPTPKGQELMGRFAAKELRNNMFCSGGRGELRSPLHPPLPPPSGYGTDSFKGSP